MNEEFIKEIIKSTISGESHLGTNLKEQCLMYFDNLISENKKFSTPVIQVCEKCGQVDNECIIKKDKHIYQVCDECGHKKDKGLFNDKTLKLLGYKIERNDRND